jgi:aldehyde dehydrogenase (NAD+)
MNRYPKKIYHWIDGKEVPSRSGHFIDKVNPADGEVLTQVTGGNKEDVKEAVNKASEKFAQWSETSVIERADILRRATLLMQERKEEIAGIVHLETGKSVKDALAEVNGAIELGFFMAGEGTPFYGKTTTSAMENRMAMTIRQPVGVCALIVPFNTPIANVAWKSFPSLLCGNTVVLKAASDAPYTPVWFAKILKEAGLPAGVFNVVQGTGEEVGQPLIENERIDLISFTGSTETGKYIQKVAGSRLVKISLEMGGKNALVVCDDASLEDAVNWAILSAFSNAGQRCSAGSRIIVFEKVYEKFKKLFLDKTKKLRVGSSDSDDLGPVINQRQLNNILHCLEEIKNKERKLLYGGYRLTSKQYSDGYYMLPTVLEAGKYDDSNYRTIDSLYDQTEIFGPVTCLYMVKDLKEAITLTNNSPYGLTAAIHSKSHNRIQYFIHHTRVGVMSVNGPTYGSEPHLPFGGLRNSGTGWREPGTEVLDFYSEWKTVYVRYEPSNI